MTSRPSPTPIAWTPIALPLDAGDHPTAVAGMAAGFAAVGFSCPGGRWFCARPQPVAWTSPDGSTWVRHAVAGLGPLAPIAMAWFEGHLVVIADVATGASWPRRVLTSDDGIRWDDLPGTWTASGRPVRPAGPCRADGEGGAVVCQASLVSAPGWLTLTQGGIWLSRDGLSWSQIDPTHTAAFHSEDGGSGPLQLAASGDTVVAVTSRDAGSTEVVDRRRSTFWWSADLTSWNAASAPSAAPSVDEEIVGSIVATDRGFVALAELVTSSREDPSLGLGEAACFWSPDGRSWRRADAGLGIFATVVAIPGGALAVAQIRDGTTLAADVSAGDCDWASGLIARPTSDGWTAPMLAADPAHMVLVGTSGGQGWVAPLPGG